MGKSKRGSASLDYDEPSKRSRYSSNAPPKEGSQGRIDPTYGQRSAFPGLDDQEGFVDDDEDLDYGDDAGALSYLRAVRSEAAGIPTVIVAPRPILGDDEDRTIYDDGVGDSRGFYSDGAYTAAPEPQPDTPTDIPLAKHLRADYFEKILERFQNLREQLGNNPPDDVVKKLDQNHDSYMSASAPDYRKWRWRVINTEPMNAQLARMDRATSLKLLRLLTNDKLAMGGNTIPTERLSRWIWGVLARLPDSGELNSEEIGLVRDLGKRAVWLGVVMNQPQSDTAAGMPGDEDNAGEEDYEGDEEEGEKEEEIPIPESKENPEERANKPRVNTAPSPQGNVFLFDRPSTHSDIVHADLAKVVLEDCFWGDTPRHIVSQFNNDLTVPVAAYKGHVPNKEIYHDLRGDDGYCIVLGDRGGPLTKEQLRAKERLRNFFRRNREYARSRLPFDYCRNPAAEQYDGPLPPKKFADGSLGADYKEFIRQNPVYTTFEPNPCVGRPRDTADDEHGDKAFDRAWRIAGLDTPQTRIYDDDKDEEEEIAMAKLGLCANKDPRPAVVEDPKPENQDEEETLDAARNRILAQLGGAEDTDAADLAQAREALKEQERKEKARVEEEDAARRLNAKATVDMIITVAGEVYGQRDLLEFRETWD